jgi:hypothetical protein
MRKMRTIVAIGLVVALIAGAVALLVATTQQPSTGSVGTATAPPGTTEPDGGDLGTEPDQGRSGESTDPDGEEGTQERLDALAAAKADGTFGVAATITRRRPAPGWAGERVMAHHYDDWEPDIAADPKAPFVYRLATRFGGPPACAKDCPDPAIILQVSKNDGRTWGPFRYLCTCRGTNGMYDPEIAVAGDTGIVEAAFMRGLSIWFSRSTDHGKTWSKPVPVYGDVSWQDKPILTTSADGTDVYVAFNGPSHGDAWVAFSHDGGTTWHQRKVTHNHRYFYAFGGVVLPDGTVVYSESSLTYRPGDSLYGTSRATVLRSADGGRTWTSQVLDTFALGRACHSTGCRPDYYDGQTSLGLDGAGNLLFLSDGAKRERGVRGVFAWTSADGGVTWGPRVRVSPTGVNASFPAAVGDPGGGFRIWFMDRRTGRWGVWYRTSADGVSWTKAVRISDATGGADYLHPNGFGEAYGDYGGIDITDSGKTVAAWGEGPSYAGPGGIWFNRQT